MAENWVLVAGWPGYEVSDHGRVRNVATGHIFAQNRNSKGYVTVSFFQRKPLRPKSFKVHRLVAQAFIPNPGGLPQINHKDFDRANNHASNLEWVTGKQNVAHSVEAGRQFAHSNPKKVRALSGEDVAEIRAALTAGEFISDIAVRFGVQASTIAKINLNKTRTNDPSAAGHIPARQRKPCPPRVYPLNPRDVEMHSRVQQGERPRDIGKDYGLTPRQVSHAISGHKKRIARRTTIAPTGNLDGEQ